MANVPVGHVLCTFTVNGVRSPEHPMDFELRQEWGRHDLLFARLVVPKGRRVSQLTAWPDGAAVAVQWGRKGAGVLTWYGYINHHVIDTSDDMSGQDIQITYVLVGTSNVMNGDRNRVWEHTTADVIAQKIAREHSLRCVVTRSTWQLKYEAQAHESDFAFLNRLAAKIGYRFYVTGGTMYMIDPVVLLAGQTSSNVPTYSVDRDSYRTDTAHGFQVEQGDYLPGAFSYTRRIWGIDDRTGQVFHVDADGSTGSDYIVNTTRYTTSRAEAKRLQNAQQSLGQFWIAATVEVFGCTLLYPGKAVNLQGTHIPDHNAGAWIVTAARHVLRSSGSPVAADDSYVTRLRIVSNIKNVIPRIKGIQQVTPEVIGCNLAGGIWRANTLNVIIEGTI